MKGTEKTQTHTRTLGLGK